MIRSDQRKRMLARRAGRRWLAGALVAVCVAANAPTWAEDGVRELTNPDEMAKVAPVRAVGIRLMPAAPIRTSISESGISESGPTKSGLSVLSPTPGRVASLPATASLKVSVNTAHIPVVADPVANARSRAPERIIPKPMLVEAIPAIPRDTFATSTGKQQGGAAESVRVVPQAPIRLSFSNEEVHSRDVATSVAPSLPPIPNSIELAGTGRTTVSIAESTTARGPLLLAKSESAPPVAVSPAADLEVEAPHMDDVGPSTIPTLSPIPSSSPTPTYSPIPTASPDANAFVLPSRSPMQPTSLPVVPEMPVATPTPEATTTAELPSPLAIAMQHPVQLPVQPTVSEAVDTVAHDMNQVIDDAIATDLPPSPQAHVPAMQLAAPRLIATTPTATPVAKVYSDEELSKAIGVELESQGAREVQVDVAITGLHVNDERICRAISSDGRVYLVGGELGETTVEVSSASSSEPKLLRVKVIAPWQRSAHGVADLDQLRHALRPMCTDSKLSIRAQHDGSIVVSGVVDSKETAKRVLELTRKLTLVPVVDKLEIR